MTISPHLMNPITLSKSNCNLELCLSPPSSSSPVIDTAPAATTARYQSMMNNNCDKPSILHNSDGEFSVADFTEIQAKAIIMRAASREMESKSTSTVEIESGATLSLSMKRSVQTFLQNRNKRRIHY